ncbi:MAG: hypothetical protein D6713_06215 [Deltaproteobacteria bacterium]|nr:MAG: hypothetical protein D6713_06215 [Deltaproteobacteria bacterium]
MRDCTGQPFEVEFRESQREVGGIRKHLLPYAVFLLFFVSATPAFSGGKLESSKTCRPCHLEIYLQWSSSRHASSFTEPFFRQTFLELARRGGGEEKVCLACHSPAYTVSPEENLPLKDEGVTCDFCHTLNRITVEEGIPRFENTPGIKRGPIEEADSSYHRTAFSSLHLSSEFCGGCHDYVNAHGLRVLSTYTEWKESFYRGEGIHCQYCHLPELYEDRQYKKHPSKERPPDHTMKGGHFESQLRKSLTGRGEISFSRGEAVVRVTLRNERSGHKIPTGIPTHRVVIDAVIFNERGVKIGEGEAYIERILGDGKGNPLENPADIFLRAREVLKDNRVGPKQSKTYTLKIPVKGSVEKARGVVTLFYELPSADPNLKRVRVRFADISLEKQVFHRTVLGLFFALLLIAVVLLAYDIALRIKKKG